MSVPVQKPQFSSDFDETWHTYSLTFNSDFDEICFFDGPDSTRYGIYSIVGCLDVWMFECPVRSRGHSFQAILMKRGTRFP